VTKQGNEVPDKDQVSGLSYQARETDTHFAMWFVTQNTPGRQLEGSQENNIVPVMVPSPPASGVARARHKTFF